MYIPQISAGHAQLCPSSCVDVNSQEGEVASVCCVSLRQLEPARDADQCRGSVLAVPLPTGVTNVAGVTRARPVHPSSATACGESPPPSYRFALSCEIPPPAQSLVFAAVRVYLQQTYNVFAWYLFSSTQNLTFPPLESPHSVVPLHTPHKLYFEQCQCPPHRNSRLEHLE